MSARKPLGVVFFALRACFMRLRAGKCCALIQALFVKSSQKLFTLASQAALERFAQLSAAHGSGASRCLVLRTA